MLFLGGGVSEGKTMELVCRHTNQSRHTDLN